MELPDQSLWEIADLLGELEKRKKHGFTQYKPLPEQLNFHKSTHWCRMAFGGNRSGKSKANSQEILWYCTESHPYQSTPAKPRIWVIAPEYRIIYEGIWGHLRNSIPQWEIEKFGSKIPGWDIPSYIKFKKGGQIDFISAEGGDSDRKKLQAAEVDLVSIDEEVGADLVDEIIARLVTKGGRIILSATLINSEEWILDWELKADNNDPNFAVFRFSTKDNPHNDQKVLQIFIDRLSPEDKLVRLEGRSRTVKGIYYKTSPEFWIDPIQIPKHWPVIHIFDSGFKVAAALWIRASPDGHFYITDEMYLTHTSLRECVDFFYLTEGWSKYEGVWIRTDRTLNVHLRIIDPSDFNTNKDGSIGPAYQLSEHYGFDFIAGINNKTQNIEDVRRLLIPKENPRLKAFNNLQFLRSEISKYRPIDRKTKRNTDDVKDRPLKKHDHLMNCLEYFASYSYEYGDYQLTKEEEAKLRDDDIDWPADPIEYRNKRLAIAKLRMNKRYRRG